MASIPSFNIVFDGSPLTQTPRQTNNSENGE